MAFPRGATVLAPPPSHASGAAPVPGRPPSRGAAPSLSKDEAGFDSECVEFFAEVVQAFGVPRSVGQIYGLLFASSQPLSFTDIAERLEISKGSVSQGLQLLRSLGAVRSVAADSRREYFLAELGLRRLVIGVIRERMGPLVAGVPDRIDRLRRLAKQRGPAGEFYLDRIKQLETWRRRIKVALPVLGVLLGPKSKR